MGTSYQRPELLGVPKKHMPNCDDPPLFGDGEDIFTFAVLVKANSSLMYASRQWCRYYSVSEVDRMSAIYPVSIHRRIERQWANRMKSPQSRIKIPTEEKLRPAFTSDNLKSIEASAIGRSATTQSA
jgi:hypothetical protein